MKSLSLDNVLFTMNNNKKDLYFELCDDEDIVLDGTEIIIGYNHSKTKVEFNDFYYFKNGKINQQKFQEFLQKPLYINPYKDVCCICLDNIISVTNSSITDCGHKFHKKCLISLYQYDENSKCPYCRVSTSVIDYCYWHQNLANYCEDFSNKKEKKWYNSLYFFIK